MAAPTNPITTISYAYDGEGNRVAQSVTAGGGYGAGGHDLDGNVMARVDEQRASVRR